MQFHNDTIYLLVLLMVLGIMVLLLLSGNRKRRKKKSKELSQELLSERKKLFHAILFPGFFLFLIWFVKFIEFGLETDFTSYGIYPGNWNGLGSIVTAPLIHANIKHLIDNSVPVFVLGVAIFYFYHEIAYTIFFIIYFVTGFLVWIAGREAYHIGASGLIYGFAAFLFLSGVIRKNTNLLAISLLVIFLYGSLVWGILPYDFTISWESHLLGGLTGLAVAIVYRDEGPPGKKYSWEEEETEVEDSKKITDENHG